MEKHRKKAMATFTVHQIQDFKRYIQLGLHYKVGDFDHYTPVFRVEADDLNHVFALTNHWDDEDRVLRIDRGHSTSIGDIIETHNGEHAYWMVSFDGFNKLEVL